MEQKLEDFSVMLKKVGLISAVIVPIVIAAAQFEATSFKTHKLQVCLHYYKANNYGGYCIMMINKTGARP